MCNLFDEVLHLNQLPSGQRVIKSVFTVTRIECGELPFRISRKTFGNLFTGSFQWWANREEVSAVATAVRQSELSTLPHSIALLNTNERNGMCLFPVHCYVTLADRPWAVVSIFFDKPDHIPTVRIELRRTRMDVCNLRRGVGPQRPSTSCTVSRLFVRERKKKKKKVKEPRRKIKPERILRRSHDNLDGAVAVSSSRPSSRPS